MRSPGREQLFHFSDKTSCAVGAPPSMKIAWRDTKSFIFSMRSGSFHSSALIRHWQLLWCRGALLVIVRISFT